MHITALAPSALAPSALPLSALPPFAFLPSALNGAQESPTQAQASAPPADGPTGQTGQTGSPGSQPGSPPPPGSPFTGMLVPLLLCAAVFYLLVLGPERKNRKKREAMLKNIGKGDKVMTTGGLYATVAAVQEDVVTLQIADGVRARFSRSAVQSVLGDDDAAKSASEKPAERETVKK